MSSKKEPVKEVSTVKHAILFELENVAFKGRDVLFDIIEDVFKSRDIKITPPMYSRMGLYSSLGSFATALLESEKKKLSVDKVVSEIKEGFKKKILANSAKADSVMQKIVKKAVEMQMGLGVWSTQDEQTAKALLVKTGAPDQGVGILCCRNEERPYISTEAWLKLAKNTGVPPALCLVLATCKKSCKAALNAGMKSVVVPDRFTVFQDFGGADMVSDVLNDEVAETIFDLLSSN